MENKKQFFSRLHTLEGRDYSLVKKAYMLAKHGHRWQKRQELGPDGKPLRYFEHCRRVALIIIDELGIIDMETICIALLHDGPEDTDDITCKDLEYWFTLRVGESIRYLSKLPKVGYEERLLGCGEWRALMTKGCDCLDNLRSLGACSKEKQERKLQETVEKYYPIFDRMVEITPVHYQQRAEKLFTLIKKEVTRLQKLAS